MKLVNINFIGYIVLYIKKYYVKIINMAHVIKYIKMVNFKKSRGLNQRQCSSFLKDLESKYSGLPYYTEVRWLSCSKVLKRF